MKLYTLPEMSKKLVALGCVSQSNMFWVGGQLFYVNELFDEDGERVRSGEDRIPAFEFEDFAGSHIEATINRLCLFRAKDDADNETMQKDIVDSKNWVEEIGRGL